MKPILLVISLMFSPVLYAQQLLISDPYIKGNIPGTKNTSGYLTLENHSDRDIKIVDVKTAVAKRAELHEHSMDNDKMMMRKVDSVQVKAHSQVVFNQHGYHIMFIGVKQNLKAGQTVELKLIYADGQEQEIEMPVVDPRGKKQGKKAADKHHH